MSAPPPPIIKGWCPGALRPMQSGDGLVVRVRPHGGCLSRAQVAGLAELAQAHGNGLVDFSARANLQLRGIRLAGHAAVLGGLNALGLLDPDPETESARNIMVTPFWQSGDAAIALARALETRLGHAVTHEGLRLPGKFGFSVDCAGSPVLRQASADIRLERTPSGALLLYPDGADKGRLVEDHEAAEQAVTLANWFVRSGGTCNGRGRMAAHVRRTPLPPGYDVAVPDFPPFVARPGPTPGGWMAGLAFGQCTAATLSALATMAPLRLTPWRMIVAEGLSAPPSLVDLLPADDPLLRVAACTGAPACPQALAPVRTLATDLAPHVPAHTFLHVSGCAKGCAHPQAAPLTLVAQPEGFALIRHGTTTDQPIACNLSAELLRTHPELMTKD